MFLVKVTFVHVPWGSVASTARWIYPVIIWNVKMMVDVIRLVVSVLMGFTACIARTQRHAMKIHV
jgi:hypothetical protein